MVPGLSWARQVAVDAERVLTSLERHIDSDAACALRLGFVWVRRLRWCGV